jgi:hypothetical protein
MSRRTTFPWKAIVATVGLLFAVGLIWNLMTSVDASERVVKQTIGGELSVFETPGYKWQGMAKLTSYPRAIPFNFDGSKNDDTGAINECLPIRFNDQGRAKICGSMVVEPPGGNQLVKLHKQFGSIDAVMKSLVVAAISKATYQTGPLMSSRESAAEKRGDLQAFIEDQAKKGYYKKTTKEVKVDDPSAPMIKDPRTGKMVVSQKLVKISEPVLDKTGNPVIQEESALAKFNLNFYNFAIKRIVYSESVQNQIEAQRAREVAIQTAIAQAKKAEQDAKTAKANEVAQVAEMRAKMEVEKIEAVTKAEKTRDVAELNLEKAKLDAKAVIAAGEAEAEARKLKMQADGALEQKLKALVEINKNYAVALAKAQPGALVSNFNMSTGGTRAAGGNANDLVQLLTAQTAKQLSTNLTPK